MRAVALLLGGIVLAGGLLGGPAIGADRSPTLDRPSGRWQPEQVVTVTGRDFTPGEQVTFDVCGAKARRGTKDCALGSQTSNMAWSDGTVHATTVVRRPPRPCPCVVLATGVSSGERAVRRVRIKGMPVRRIIPVATTTGNQVDVTARLTGGSSWAEWFGWPVSRVLEVQVESRTDVPVVLQVSQGGDRDAAGFVAGKVLPRDGESGETLSFPVTFGALEWGTRHVAGTVRALDAEVGFDATTTVRPWGLVVLAVTGAGILAAVLVRRLRRAGRVGGARRAPRTAGTFVW